MPPSTAHPPTTTPSTAPDPTLISSAFSAPKATKDTTAATATKPNATPQGTKPTQTQSKKRKKKNKLHPQQSPTLTLPSSQWSYLHLNLTFHSSSVSNYKPTLDATLARIYLTSALEQFLGETGAALSVEILDVDDEKQECWVRVPRLDATAVVAAVGGWTSQGEKGSYGWRVKAWGDWLGGVVYGAQDGGRDLFGEG